MIVSGRLLRWVDAHNDRQTSDTDGLEIFYWRLNASQGYILRELHGSFSADGDDDVAQSPGVEARFTIREVVLTEQSGQCRNE